MDIWAGLFSTVTISGRASDLAFDNRSSACRAKLRLKRVPMIPKLMPPAGGNELAPPVNGRFTRFPPVGSPVAAATGRRLARPNGGTILGFTTPGNPVNAALGAMPVRVKSELVVN